MAKIGFTTIFSYRPHVSIMYFLSEQFKKQGHEVYFLNCSGGLECCYTQALRYENSRLKECTKCLAGSLYSYTNENMTFIDKKIESDLSSEKVRDFVKSSTYTALRIEDPKDKESPIVTELQNKLIGPAKIVYENTIKWIGRNQLEYVFFFNGRMDLTRAVLEACKASKIKYSSVERTAFGHGIQFNPYGNCLDLKNLNNLVENFSDKPLTLKQARISASFITSRFRNERNLEWRNYNLNEEKGKWPVESSKGYKILIMPSSTNETMEHPDWDSGWSEFTIAFEEIVKRSDTSLKEVVLRAHPNWSEKIGHTSGEKIEKYYRDWCESVGATYIPADDKISSRDLMREADFIILTGSSAVFEASLLGTPCICVKDCFYSKSKIATMILNLEDLSKVDFLQIVKRKHDDLIKFVLRFIYTFIVRQNLFFDETKSLSSVEYIFKDYINVDKILNILDGKEDQVTDKTCALNTFDEDKLIVMIKEKRWNDLKYENLYQDYTQMKSMKRRSMYRLVDIIRKKLKRGDM